MSKPKEHSPSLMENEQISHGKKELQQNLKNTIWQKPAVKLKKKKKMPHVTDDNSRHWFYVDAFTWGTFTSVFWQSKSSAAEPQYFGKRHLTLLSQVFRADVDHRKPALPTTLLSQKFSFPLQFATFNTKFLEREYLITFVNTFFHPRRSHQR